MTKLPILKDDITAKSVWEEAQTLGSEKRTVHKIELEIPGVLFISIENDNYLVYVNVNGEMIKLSNYKDKDEQKHDKSVKRSNDRKKHNSVSE